MPTERLPSSRTNIQRFERSTCQRPLTHVQPCCFSCHPFPSIRSHQFSFIQISTQSNQWRTAEYNFVQITTLKATPPPNASGPSRCARRISSWKKNVVQIFTFHTFVEIVSKNVLQTTRQLDYCESVLLILHLSYWTAKQTFSKLHLVDSLSFALLLFPQSMLSSDRELLTVLSRIIREALAYM